MLSALYGFAALIDAINATRARIESGYKVAVPAARAPSRLSAAGASPPPSLSLRSLDGRTDDAWQVILERIPDPARAVREAANLGVARPPRAAAY